VRPEERGQGLIKHVEGGGGGGVLGGGGHLKNKGGDEIGGGLLDREKEYGNRGGAEREICVFKNSFRTGGRVERNW